MIHSE